MKDLKEILTFIGCSFKNFFNYLVLNFLILILTLILIILLFFICLKFIYDFFIFYSFVFALIIIVYLLRRYIFIRKDFGINYTFFNYLKGKKDYLNIIPEGNLKNLFSKTKQRLKENGIVLILKRMKIAIAVININSDDSIFSEKDKLRRAFSITLKYLWIEFFIFLVLLILFEAISFLFTLGVSTQLKFLIYMIGFLFVYFLETALFTPIFNLIVQKKLIEQFQIVEDKVKDK